MNFGFVRSFAGAIVAAILLLPSARAEEHRATHLGNLSTRFAPPPLTPDDLRARFRDPKLQPDFVEILRQWGWPGNTDDLFKAALSNSISEVEIPVGTTMPFMSSREGGKPVCLRNVLWAGKLPISAHAFNFISNGRRYRCVTPIPCCNFFVEDLGPEPKPVLTLDCTVPEKIPVGRNLQACLTLHNRGDAAASNIVLSLSLPASVMITNVNEGGVVSGDQIKWEISGLAPNADKQVCITLTAPKIGSLLFQSSATGSRAPPVQSACETKVFGIPAILLEKLDDPDPVAVGDITTYTVKVTNQGTAADSNVQIVVIIAPELVPVSASAGTISDQTVTLPLAPELAAKEVLTYTITARGVKAGDGHTKFTLASEMLKSPIMAEESTTVY